MCGFLSKVSGVPWFGGPLEALEAFGGFWRLLEAPGGPWRPLKAPGGSLEGPCKRVLLGGFSGMGSRSRGGSWQGFFGGGGPAGCSRGGSPEAPQHLPEKLLLEGPVVWGGFFEGVPGAGVPGIGRVPGGGVRGVPGGGVPGSGPLLGLFEVCGLLPGLFPAFSWPRSLFPSLFWTSPFLAFCGLLPNLFWASGPVLGLF